MTQMEWLVIGVGAPAGYWLVSFLFGGAGRRTGQGPKLEPRGAGDRRNDATTNGQTGATKTWFEVLELQPNAGADEIRSAYQRLISQYHPDKVASLGSELKELANRKSQEINQAYRTGMAMRGLTA